MIKKLDHVVITARDPLITVNFYKGLGFEGKKTDGKYELYGGDFKINVHTLGKELSPRAQFVQPGSADLCFEISESVEEYKKVLEGKGFKMALGVVARNGVKGAMRSIYLRDPDGNLIEFCSYG